MLGTIGQEEHTQEEPKEFDPTTASVDELTERLSKAQTSEPEAEEPEATSKDDPKEASSEESEDPEGKPTQTAEAETKEQDDPATLKKRVQDKERMLQRQAWELGRTRKEKAELTAKLAELEKKIQSPETPEDIIDHKLELRDVTSQLKSTEAREKIATARALVETLVEPQEGLPETMIECLKADGVDDEYIRSFYNNPYEVATPGEIVQLAGRAKDRMIAKELYGYLQQALRENAELRGKPEALLDKVDAVLQRGPSVSGTNGRSPIRVNEFATSDLASMGLEQLHEALREANRKAGA